MQRASIQYWRRMTRDELIQAALADREDRAAARRALDAALVDIGGLDGLDDVHLKLVRVTADRDRLREALREIATRSPYSNEPVSTSGAFFPVAQVARAALHASEEEA